MIGKQRGRSVGMGAVEEDLLELTVMTHMHGVS